MSRNRRPELAFDAITIEGSLLAADWLARVSQLKAPHQAPTDYGVPKGLDLRDEIGRYWRVAQAHWADFEAGRRAKAEPNALSRRFIVSLLREAFGFSDLAERPPVSAASLLDAPRGDDARQPLELQGRAWPITAIDPAGRVPLVCGPAGAGLDSPHKHLGDEGRKRSAFGLLQELLNASDDAMWGLCSDGLTLRLVRDNASLTRPAWVEVDLARIFSEGLYPDFAAAWLLLHRSRFGRPDQPPESCPLEAWRSAVREEGTRARERLRGGFEDALLILGQGFLAHPSNHSLRKALHSGTLTRKAYFGELLRLVYRLIFLLTIEERGLLHPKGTPKEIQERYAAGYGLQRLRERSARRAAHDRHADLWQAMKIVFRGLAQGEDALGLPALVGLFASGQCPNLDSADLDNRSLLSAVFRLCWLREPAGLERVNWRDMGPDELGYVYEGLLELVPQITQDGRTFTFAGREESRGNARKTSGSYYTPESLVHVLLDSALEPVVADTLARNPDAPAQGLLTIAIVDPACGSGHFLLAAARRLATHVARVSSSGTPSAEEYRHALRQVVSRCIFGVDLNPMAIELCKVSLWMEAIDPGLPLTFLDSHIQHGNALLGTTPALMEGGVPDAAWEPIEGDDRKTASALKKRNKVEAKQATLDFNTRASDAARAITRAVTELDDASDADADGLARKEQGWTGILASESYRHQKQVADAWCAAFVWPKVPGALAEAAPTNDVWRKLRDGGTASPLTTTTVAELAEQYHFFHWHLQFPQVFARGGFDVVLGNPPWEHVELKEEEWFAQRVPEIATAPTAAIRKRMILELETDGPEHFSEYRRALRLVQGETHLARQSGRFPLCARGRINTYALFAELNHSLLGTIGKAGFIVPPGIATDEGTSPFFSTLVTERELARFDSYENFGVTFSGVNNRQSFSTMVLSRKPVTATFCFHVNQKTGTMGPQEYQLSPEDISLLNPNTRTSPTFRSRRDADLNIAIYKRTGVLWSESKSNGNPWQLRFMQGVLNLASDSNLFRTRSELEAGGWKLAGNHFALGTERALPLYEAKMIHHFDHRFASLVDEADSLGRASRKFKGWFSARVEDPTDFAQPQYWVLQKEVDDRLAGKWDRDWLLGWRDIVRSTDQRTVIASIMPRVAIGHTAPLLLPNRNPKDIACLYASLCSFVLDYTARQKIGGTHLTYGYLKQLPVLGPDIYEATAPWASGICHRDWLMPRILELSYTAWDLQPFARDCGDDGPPYIWNADRRFQLQCELDAAFFHLYGLSGEEVAYVLDTFPVVENRDKKEYGEFRTKGRIIEAFDALAHAASSGQPYVSPLGPPKRAALEHERTQDVSPRSDTARVLAFPTSRSAMPAVPAPLPNLASVETGAWMRPHSTELGEAQAAILAVVKAHAGPIPRSRARLAALLCLEPHLLTPMLDKSDKTQWVRLVGDDAKKRLNASIGRTADEWGPAVKALRGRGRVVEDLDLGTWALAGDLPETGGWPDGRATFVLDALRRLDQASQPEVVLSKLPEKARLWLVQDAA